jgi:hypothetical protein
MVLYIGTFFALNVLMRAVNDVPLAPQTVSAVSATTNIGSATQQSVINQTIQYGAQRGVSVNVIPFP